MEKKRYQGKVAIWYYLFVVACNVVMIVAFCDSGNVVFDMILFLATNLLLVPFAVKNYVEITNGEMRVTFGFCHVTMKIEEIVSIRETLDPIASMAASLDRIEIKTRNSSVLISVKEKKVFMQELVNQNSNIQYKI